MSTFVQDHFLLLIHHLVLAALLDLMLPHLGRLSACSVLLERSPLHFQPHVLSVRQALHHQLVLQLVDRAGLVLSVKLVQIRVGGVQQGRSRTNLVVPLVICAHLAFTL